MFADNRLEKKPAHSDERAKKIAPGLIFPGFRRLDLAPGHRNALFQPVAVTSSGQSLRHSL